MSRKAKLDVTTKGFHLVNPTCGCGKIGFDKKGAQTKRNILLKRGNAKELRIYACPQSQLWHLTKT